MNANFSDYSPSEAAEEVLLTTKDLAVLLRCSPTTIEGRRHRGADLPPGLLFGRYWRYPLSWVMAWMEAHHRQ